VLIDQKGGGNLLYLPLDKLMQMTAGGVASGAAPEAPASAKTNDPAAPAAEGAVRGREAFRSREREARQ
jgi:membrane protease subunit HflK